MATLPVGSLGCWLSFRWAIYFYPPRRIFEPHVDLDIDLPNIAMLTLAPHLTNKIAALPLALLWLRSMRTMSLITVL